MGDRIVRSNARIGDDRLRNRLVSVLSFSIYEYNVALSIHTNTLNTDPTELGEKVPIVDVTIFKVCVNAPDHQCD